MNHAQADAIMRRARIISTVDKPCPPRLRWTQRILTLRCPVGRILAVWLHWRQDARAWRAESLCAHCASPGRVQLAQLAPGDDVAALHAWRLPDLPPRDRAKLIRYVLARLEPEAERWSASASTSPARDLPLTDKLFPRSWGRGSEEVDARTGPK